MEAREMVRPVSITSTSRDNETNETPAYHQPIHHRILYH